MQCSLPEEVRNLMCSLMCMEHNDWGVTLHVIAERGGKASTGKLTNLLSTSNSHSIKPQDWVQDKIQSKFVFKGMC
jgi:hypothetical protein